MCRLCSSEGKECPCPPEWIVRASKVNWPLTDSKGLRCGETRRGGELVALCADCLVKCWCETNPVIRTYR